MGSCTGDGFAGASWVRFGLADSAGIAGGVLAGVASVLGLVAGASGGASPADALDTRTKMQVAAAAWASLKSLRISHL